MYKWSSYSKTSLVIVKPLEGTNKSCPQWRCRGVPFKLQPRLQFFKFSDYHRTATIFNVNILAASLASNQT